MVGAHQIATLGFGNGTDVGLPRIRVEHVATFLVEPLQLATTQHEDAAQHQLGHLVGMRLRIGQRQR